MSTKKVVDIRITKFAELFPFVPWERLYKLSPTKTTATTNKNATKTCSGSDTDTSDDEGVISGLGDRYLDKEYGIIYVWLNNDWSVEIEMDALEISSTRFFDSLTEEQYATMASKFNDYTRELMFKLVLAKSYLRRYVTMTNKPQQIPLYTTLLEMFRYLQKDEQNNFAKYAHDYYINNPV